MALLKEIDLGEAVEELAAEGKSAPDLTKVTQWMTELYNLEQVLEEGLKQGKPIDLRPEIFAKFVKNVRQKMESAVVSLAQEYILNGRNTKVTIDTDAMGVVLIGVRTINKVSPVVTPEPTTKLLLN